MTLVDRLLAKLERDGLASTMVAVLRMPYTIRRRMEYRTMLAQATSPKRFAMIYEKRLWCSEESGSGEGSEVEYTERLRDWLVDAVPKYGIQKIVDAACGDFNWMKLVVPKLDIEYCGFDIVESVVLTNARMHASDKVAFSVANICHDKLPKCDLLMIRDCLFHLSYDDVNKVLRNIATVDYKYLVTTTHVVDERFSNTDIVTGDFRTIDLFGGPFNFKEENVIDRVDDFPVGYSIPRQMVLLAKEDVPEKLAGPGSL